MVPHFEQLKKKVFPLAASVEQGMEQVVLRMAAWHKDYLSQKWKTLTCQGMCSASPKSVFREVHSRKIYLRSIFIFQLSLELRS